MTNKILKPIRSFVTRKGRTCLNHQNALEQYGAQYLLPVPQQTHFYNWKTVFARKAPVILEIGFGMGDNLLHMAQSHPELNYIGIEVHHAGVARVVAQAQRQQLGNLRVFNFDACEILVKAIPDQSLSQIFLLFPDPWPKSRHHKRRIVQAPFIEMLVQKLEIQGTLVMATDWAPYADQMLSLLEASSALENCAGSGCFASQARSTITKFEARGQRLGHKIYDLVYRRV